MALSLLEADSPAVTTLAPHAAPVSRPARTSAEMALFGIYEISKILATPMRLEVALASVANILTSFLQMRRGVIVVLDGEGEPEIVATGGVSRVIKGKTLRSIPQLVIDRIDITRAGGYAVWFGDKLRVETVEGRRGVRPWSVKPPRRRRLNTAG